MILYYLKLKNKAFSGSAGRATHVTRYPNFTQYRKHRQSPIRQNGRNRMVLLPKPNIDLSMRFRTLLGPVRFE